MIKNSTICEDIAILVYQSKWFKLDPQIIKIICYKFSL